MKKEQRKITIAIDGFSSSGKSTMAKHLAKTIGYAYIDTGAMYRAVTLYALDHDMIHSDNVNVEALTAALDDIVITFGVDDDGTSFTCLNGRNVESDIRSMRVSDKVSLVAAIAPVRRAMVRQQQAMGRDKGIVMDGRDIGTVVFPDAEMKVFVNASAETRARRRFDELRAKGDTTTTYEQVLANVVERDRIDSTRDESPLRRAHDAVDLDNSSMTIDEQNRWMLDLFKQRAASYEL